MSSAPPARPLAWAAVAACVAALYLGWQVWQILETPYPAAYDYDEGVYAETALVWAHGSPLYRTVFLSQPPAYIAALRLAYGAAGPTIATARATAVLASGLWLAALFSLAAAAGRPRAGVFAVCAAAGNGAFSLAAHTVQTDAPSAALAAAAVAFTFAGRRGRLGYWAAAGVVWGLAILTKLSALIETVPLVLLATSWSVADRPGADASPAASAARLMETRHGHPARRRPTEALPPLGALGAGAAAAIAAFLPVLWTRAFPAQVIQYHMAAARAYGSDPAANLTAAAGFLWHAWPLTGAAILGVWAGARPSRPSPPRSGAMTTVLILLAWLFAAAGALAGLRPLWPHHLILLISPLAVLAGIGVDGAMLGIERRGRSAAAAVAVTAAVATATYVGIATGSRLPTSPALRAASEAVAASVPRQEAVVTDDPLVPFLAGRLVPAAVIDTSLVRVASGNLTESSIVAALERSDVRAVVIWRGTFERLPRVAACTRTLFPIVAARDGFRRVLVRSRAAAAPGQAERCAPTAAGSSPRRHG